MGKGAQNLRTFDEEQTTEIGTVGLRKIFIFLFIYDTIIYHK